MCYGHDGAGALERSLETRGTDRRGFLRGALAAAGAGFAVGGSALPAVAAPGRELAKKRKLDRDLISIQLYTMRSVMSGEGVDETLASLADIRYPRVELAGLYGRAAADMRATLDDLGLWASSSHDGISGDAAGLAQKINNATTLGQSYMNVPFLASDSADQWRAWADQMNGEAAQVRAAGIRYGYHNHAHEFTTDLGGGLTPWDIFMTRLDPKLVHLEVDLYWVVTGGYGVGASDPDQFAIDVIEDSPLETIQYHVKDRDASGDFADPGTGEIDFARIFDAHQVEEYIVENDQPDVTPLQTAAVGHRYLSKIKY